MHPKIFIHPFSPFLPPFSWRARVRRQRMDEDGSDSPIMRPLVDISKQENGKEPSYHKSSISRGWTIWREAFLRNDKLTKPPDTHTKNKTKE